MKIAIAGIGYVGYSLLRLLSKDHEVVAIDPQEDKIRLLRKGISPLSGEPFSTDIPFKATTDKKAYAGQDMVFISVPTDYSPATKHLDTSLIDDVIREVMEENKKAIIVIKSTVPVGYTLKARIHFDYTKILFCPEFLRESSYLEDTKNPSRIVIGAEESEKEEALELKNILSKRAPSSTKFVLTSTGEAESIKLLSNAYLAMRVSFFNEVDSLAMEKGFSSKRIIEGISFDPRIGDFYNTPSFGFGGYCLPKDQKEAVGSFARAEEAPLLASIGKSNDVRKHLIAQDIVKEAKGQTIGFYLLGKVSPNGKFRPSVSYDVFKEVKTLNGNIIAYQPKYSLPQIDGVEVLNALSDFKKRAYLIVADRVTDELDDVANKVFSREK